MPGNQRDNFKIDRKIDARLESAAFDTASTREDVELKGVGEEPTIQDLEYLQFCLGRKPSSEELIRFKYYFRQTLIGLGAP